MPRRRSVVVRWVVYMEYSQSRLVPRMRLIRGTNRFLGHQAGSGDNILRVDWCLEWDSFEAPIDPSFNPSFCPVNTRTISIDVYRWFSGGVGWMSNIWDSLDWMSDRGSDWNVQIVKNVQYYKKIYHVFFCLKKTNEYFLIKKIIKKRVYQ